MSMLTVEKLNKRYEKFHLKDVSFSLDEGYIMGFIGANGAGKTTTLKSMLNLVRRDSGSVTVMGKDFYKHEVQLKQDIGFIFGGVDYYPKSKLSSIAAVIKRFYIGWDDDVYKSYMKKFGLDENKKVEELSSGMKVKFALASALSHDAKLFLLDEPTSGLDPVARDELLELFQELIEDGSRSILFSTHITSDLEKCADYITYISNGEIIESKTKDDLIGSYRIVKGSPQQLGGLEEKLISFKKSSFGFTGLASSRDAEKFGSVMLEEPSLEEIMIYQSKKEAQDERSII